METTTSGPPARRILKDLLIGACLGGLAAALAWHFYPGYWTEPVAAPQDTALQIRLALQEEAQAEAARARLAALHPAPAPKACDLEALIPPSSARDGRASVEHPFPGGPREKAKVFLRQAEVATAQGRLRDAEVALLAACRENESASKAPTVPLARVLGMLGERYAAAAGAEESVTLREQLLARARHVVRLSAEAYASALGPNASRTRVARQRLDTLEGDPVIAAEMPSTPIVSAIARKAPAVDTVAVSRDRKPEPAPAPASAGPTLHADPELKQLAADLARLRAQAEAVSDDPTGFRQRTESARALRDRCQDAACLRDWYAQRRRQLLAEF